MRDFFKTLPQTDKLTGVEVGVYRGDNALLILKGLPYLEKLYLVDPYTDYRDAESYVAMSEMEFSEKEAKEKLKAFEQKITWIKKPSVEASADFDNSSLDFVYIDGNHQTDYVKEDIKAWMDKLKDDGGMGGHDYTYKFVKQAVDDMAEFYDYGLAHKKGDWWFV